MARRTRRPAAQPIDLKTTLDRLYEGFNHPDSAADPIQIVRRFSRGDDREIVAFCAAGLAFGRVASVLQSIERLLAVMGPRPAAFVRRFEPRRDAAALAPIGHRWITGVDLSALLWLLRQMLDRSGSIEGFFAEDHDPAATDVEVGLESFARRALAMDLRSVYGTTRPVRAGVGYFFPSPSRGSGCKRLNLFLRWMVRRDALDLGVWSRVLPRQLVVPLDTHVVRVGRCLRLTERVSPGWAMAQEITAALRMLDPDDPVRYDYAMCHLGMMNACGFGTARGSAGCPLGGVCHPRPRRRA